MKKELTDILTAEFKRNLKAILKERKGVTNPKKLSIASGLGETAIRDILQNRSSSPKLDTIEKIAYGLNVPVYRLIPSMIDQSYEELATLKEENALLREVSDQSFTNMDELRKAAKERSRKK
ncbi:MAG: helix-turn-helix domain-containing protein [Alphaproteobacteria bacterium]